jgi:hypothetical protein
MMNITHIPKWVWDSADRKTCLHVPIYSIHVTGFYSWDDIWFFLRDFGSINRDKAEVDNVFQGITISLSPSQIYVIFFIILNVSFCHFVCAKIICYPSELFYFIFWKWIVKISIHLQHIVKYSRTNHKCYMERVTMCLSVTL